MRSAQRSAFDATELIAICERDSSDVTPDLIEGYRRDWRRTTVDALQATRGRRAGLAAQPPRLAVMLHSLPEMSAAGKSQNSGRAERTVNLFEDKK